MPCDAVRTMPIQFTAKNRNLLEQAIAQVKQEHGIIGNYTIYIEEKTDGTLQVLCPEGWRSKKLQEYLPQTYARLAVEQSAKHFGWQLQQKTPTQLTLIRR